MIQKGAEEARNELPHLLEAAEGGQSEGYLAAIRQEPLTPLAGSGRGLWGRNSALTIRKLRDEWSR